MMLPSNRMRTLLSLLFVVCLSFGVGFATARFTDLGEVHAQTQVVEQPAEFAVFWQVWQAVHTYFIDQDQLEPTALTHGAINGLIDTLGDEGHTRFLPPAQAEAQKESISGKFYGIGATVNLQDGFPVIVAPIAGSPAEEAGIKPGDLIVGVDGEDTYEVPLNEVVDQIKGDEGTEVVLTIFRPDTETELEVPIIRGEIKISAVSWTLVPGTEVGFIRLSQFSANLHQDIVRAVADAKQAGATSLIIDLRNNPGGLLEQAINVASEFLEQGDVLLEEDAQGNRKSYGVVPGGTITEIPVVVLINRGSASASEILAGAIQDHERGIVVGETSFGTGTVLQPFELADGSTLLLGVSQWLTPEGRLIRKQGIEPDILVALPEDGGILLPVVVNELTVTELLDSGDTQLLEALEQLEQLPSLDLGEMNKYWQPLQSVK